MDKPQRILEVSQLSNACRLILDWKRNDYQSLRYRDELYLRLQELLLMESFETFEAVHFLTIVDRTQKSYIEHLRRIPAKTIYKRKPKCKQPPPSDSSEATFTSLDVLGQVLTLMEERSV